MDLIISLLIFGLIVFIIFWLIDLIAGQIPGFPVQIVKVVVAVIALIVLLRRYLPSL